MAQAIQMVPISYVLLKKQFAVARPIISYSSFIFGRLFRAASTVLNILLPAVYPGSFGLQTLPEIFQELHTFCEQTPVSELCVKSMSLLGCCVQCA